jgi:hypothetical protein
METDKYSDILTVDFLQPKCTILMILFQIIPFLTNTSLQNGICGEFFQLELIGLDDFNAICSPGFSPAEYDSDFKVFARLLLMH